MEEPEQDIREKLAGESGFCPQHGPQGELWQGVVGKVVATAIGSGPVIKRATGPKVLSQDQLYKRKQELAVFCTGAKGTS